MSNQKKIFKPKNIVQLQNQKLFKRRSALNDSNSKCEYCGCHLITETATVDHIIPISKGGKDTADNIQALCQRCNQLKADKIVVNVINKGTPEFVLLFADE